MEAAEHIVAQHTGNAGDENESAVYHGGLLAAPAEQVHARGHDVFNDRNDRGEGGEGHKQEEQRPPYPAPGHVGEHAGQGNKNQVGPGVHLHAIAEAGGEDDKARHNGHKGVQPADTGALAEKGVVLAHVAAEDLHGGNAQAQGEEGLVHSRGNNIAQAHGAYIVHVGYQVEGNALPGAGEGEAVNGQHHNQHQQRRHHYLADPLQALAQPDAAHQHPCRHRNGHPQAHLYRVGQHIGKDLGIGLAAHAVGKGARGELEEVVQHPAGYGGVVHHQQVAAENGEPAVYVPLAAGLFQGLVAQHRTLAAGAAHAQLHGQHRQAQHHQHDQVDQHEKSAAVLPRHEGEAPHIADADGAPGAHQQEAQS